MGWSITLFRTCLLWWLWPHNLQILGSLAYFCWQECIFHLDSLLFLFWTLAHPRRICLLPFSWIWFHQVVLIVKNSQELGFVYLPSWKRKESRRKHTQENYNSEQNAKYKLLSPIFTSKQRKTASALECFVRYMSLKSLVFSVSWFCNKNCWYWQYCIIVLSKKKQFGLLFPETVFSYRNNIVVQPKYKQILCQ